jgi:hypothetical protein
MLSDDFHPTARREHSRLRKTQWNGENIQHRTAQGDSWEAVLTMLYETVVLFHPLKTMVPTTFWTAD